MSGVKVMKQDLFKEFEIKGYWWLPGITDKEVSGILFYKSDTIRLEIIGVLSNDLFDENIEEKTIFGYSEKGEEITLINAFSTNFTLNSPGYSTETYVIESFVVGGHLKSIDDMSIHSLAIYPTYFSKWSGKGIFSQEYSIKDEVVDKRKQINFDEPKLFNEYVESIGANIEETYYATLNMDIFEKVDWVYNGGVKITPNEWKDFGWFMDILFKTRDLYTLFIGYPVYFRNVIFYGEEYSVGDSFQRKKYSFFIQQKEMKLKENFKWHDTMISYKDVQGNFGEILNAWFGKQKSLKTVLDLHLSDFYKDVYLETKFLNAVQALEIYHRKFFDGKVFDETVYQEYTRKILTYVQKEMSEEFKNKIMGMLQHGNEYSLSKRIRELINKNLDAETKSYLFGNSNNRSKFIQQIVDTRNFLTHYDQSGKKNVLVGIEIYYAVQRLKALTTVIIFKEICMEEGTILRKIQDNKKSAYAINKSRKLLN